MADIDAQAREELWPDYKTMRDRIGKERGWPLCAISGLMPVRGNEPAV